MDQTTTGPLCIVCGNPSHPMLDRCGDYCRACYWVRFGRSEPETDSARMLPELGHESAGALIDEWEALGGRGVPVRPELQPLRDHLHATGETPAFDYAYGARRERRRLGMAGGTLRQWVDNRAARAMSVALIAAAILLPSPASAQPIPAPPCDALTMRVYEDDGSAAAYCRSGVRMGYDPQTGAWHQSTIMIYVGTDQHGERHVTLLHPPAK